MLLAAVRVSVNKREHRVQFRIAQLTQFLDQRLVVNGIHGHMVTSIVTHLGALNAQLDVHARATAAFVQFPIDTDGRQERVLGIEGWTLILHRMQTSNFTSVNAIWLHFGLLKQTVLTNQHLFAASLNAKVIANGWPEAILPRDEVIFNAANDYDKIINCLLFLLTAVTHLASSSPNPSSKTRLAPSSSRRLST